MESNGRVSMKERLLAEAKDRAEAGGGGASDTVADAGLYPCLMEVLAPWSCPKGVRGGRIGIYIQDDRLQVCMSWPEVGQVAFCKVDKLADIIQELETRMDTGQVRWLRDRASKKL